MSLRLGLAVVNIPVGAGVAIRAPSLANVRSFEGILAHTDYDVGIRRSIMKWSNLLNSRSTLSLSVKPHMKLRTCQDGDLIVL